jgi:hypothetical protein
MLEWVSTAWLGMLAAALFWVPGMVVARLAGLRGLLAWGSAPVASSAVIGTSAIVAGQIGIRWSPWVVLAGTVLAALAAVGARRLAGGGPLPQTQPRDPAPGRRYVVLYVAVLLIVLALQARRLTTAMGTPDAFPQTFDTPFHVNSVAHILETGDASSLHMTVATADATTAFYPGLWHGVVALVAQVAPGAAVLPAVNWVTVVIVCLVWPASALALGRVVFGPSPVPLVLTAGLAFAFTQFPHQLTAFGILYPNLLSYALLPAVLALAVSVVTVERIRQVLLPLFLLALGVVAIALAQPNGLFTLGYLAVPLLIWRAASLTVAGRRNGRGLAVLLLPWAVLLLVCVAAYVTAGQIEMIADFREHVSWRGTLTPGDALEDVLSLTAMHPSRTPNVLIATLVAVGLVRALVVPRWRWLAAGYVVLIALFVVAAGAYPDHVRAELTGYWYADPQRLAAQLPLLGLPIAALGAWFLIDVAADTSARRVRREGASHAVLVPVITAAALLSIAAVLPRTEVYKDEFSYIRGAYTVEDPSVSEGLIDTDELALMGDVKRIVPEGAVVAGHPWNGSAMTWALADRRPLFTHTKVSMSADQIIVARDLGRADEDPAVCEAVERLGVEYVIVSDSYLWRNRAPGYEGLDRTAVRGVGELVARHGDARLYEITACD